MSARQSQVKRKELYARFVATWAPIAVPAIVLLVALYFYRSIFDGDLSPTHEAWGQFGDFLGGILNPVVGLITLLLLVRTLELQREELQEQRHEIRRQNNILSRQAIEQGLFAWIADYKAGLSAFTYPTEIDEITGAVIRQDEGGAALKALMRETCRNTYFSRTPPDGVVTRMASSYGPWQPAELDLHLRHILRRWDRLRAHDREHLEGLLRTLYGLFKWIDETDLDAMEKFGYASIVRARLSTTELNVLFLNGMTAKGVKFSKYIRRYALFDNYPASGIRSLDIARLAPTCRYPIEAYNSKFARIRLVNACRRLEARGCRTDRRKQGG